MKKIISIILLLSLLFALPGCSKTNTDDAVKFYYCSTEDTYGTEQGLFASEMRVLSCDKNDYPAIINAFLNGPKEKECYTPFPGGTVLEDYQFTNGYATIVLSPHMAQQTNANVIVCCACLCMTLFSFPSFQTIEIRIAEKFINGEEKLIFTRNSFQIHDASSLPVTDN